MRKSKILFLLFLLSVFIYLPKVSAMKIFVKNIANENIVVEVESSDTIEALKEKIYQKDNKILPENQELVFDGKKMENGRTLSDYNIQEESTIYLIFKEEKFRVIFDANGGKFTDLEQYVIEQWDNSYYDNLIIPTKQGYTFKGYYTEKIGGTKFDMILAESGIDSDMTFYAQWEEYSGVAPSEPEKENITTSPILPENPKTFDGISISIIVVIISFICLIGATICFKRKVKKELN